MKPPFSYGFPMVFLWFSYGFPMFFTFPPKKSPLLATSSEPGVGDGPVTLTFDLQKLTEMGAISKGSKGAEPWSVVVNHDE